jgi:ATP synthase protein I
MQVHDAQILRGAAIPTTAAGLSVAAVCLLVAGWKGLLGALFGVVVVGAFFSAGRLATGRVAKSNPLLLMNVAIITYLAQIAVLGVLLVLFRDTAAFDTKAFAWAILVSTLVWVIAEVRAFRRLKMLYVDPDGGA